MGIALNEVHIDMLTDRLAVIADILEKMEARIEELEDRVYNN